MKQNRSVKKAIVILLLTGLVLCVSACSKKEKGGDADVSADPTATPVAGEEKETPEPEQEEEPTQEPQKDPEENENPAGEPQFLYDGEPIEAAAFSDSFHNIAFDRPMYQVVSEGYTTVFNRAGSLFLAYAMLDEKFPDLKAEDVITTKVDDYFLEATDNYYRGYDARLEMDSTEEMEINGVDCMRFEGKVISEADGNNIENYAVGYTFVKDEAPCLLIGVVVEKEQTELHIDEVTNNVDEMIKTLRDQE